MTKRSRSRRGSGDHGEEHPDERWMASYMDMVTVLMCMFIVLYAMSTVDQKKFEQLRTSLATGFGAVETATVDTAEGTVVPAEMANDDGESFAGGAELVGPEPAPADLPAPGPFEEQTTPPLAGVEAADPADLATARAEVDNLRALQEQIDAGLREKNLAEAVRYVIDERGLTIRLVSSETFFLPDRAELTDQTRLVLDTVGPVLVPIPNEVGVEGHTAKLPDSFEYPLDWELSSQRSVNVLRHLVERGGVPAPRISAVGFGESRPLATGTTEAELELNRRVDIVVHSDQSEEIRKLIPGIAAGG